MSRIKLIFHHQNFSQTFLPYIKAFEMRGSDPRACAKMGDFILFFRIKFLYNSFRACYQNSESSIWEVRTVWDHQNSFLHVQKHFRSDLEPFTIDTFAISWMKHFAKLCATGSNRKFNSCSYSECAG